MNKILSAKVFIYSHLTLLVVSLVFLGGLFYILNKDQFIQNQIKQYLPVTVAPVSFEMRINSPDDDLLAFDKTLIVSGKTTTRASIVISSPDLDIAFETTPQGDFSKVITLARGVNNLTIIAFDTLGNSRTVTKNVFYSETKLDQ